MKMQMTLKTMAMSATLVAALAIVVDAAPAQTPAVPMCSIVASTPMSFGLYSVFDGSPADSTASLSFTCSGATGPVTVSLSGVTAGGTRAMANGAETLAYNIYLDAARTQVWGEGASAAFYGAPATGIVVTAILYGRVYAGQDVLTGSYADNVIATINF